MPEKPFVVSDRLLKASQILPYPRERTDPSYRPLRVFALDPAESLRSGAVATINVPFEPLSPGPIGALFKVVNRDVCANRTYHSVDLDDRNALIGDGLRPSVMEPRSHQQMVYAVAMKTYGTFRTALGRELQWGFDRPDDPGRLELHPHHSRMTNGFYDKERGAVYFGYYCASDEPAGRNLPGGYVFTCLSHDVVSHEVSHALIDGLRPNFLVHSNRDVLALHEGLSDLVAILQRFTYRDVVDSAIAQARGKLSDAGLLTDVARQFGQTTGGSSALRSAIDTQRMAQDSERTNQSQSSPQINYKKGHNGEPHLLGSVLLSAVFDAFNRIFERKTCQYVRLATGGSGVLLPGELPTDLREILAKQASELARQFLYICIRAIDYCPPVDVTFGDYLRALITADHDLVPDDPWGYREAFIDAFRMREIFPSDVLTLSEESLVWKGIPRHFPGCKALSFAELGFRGDPANSMAKDEQQRLANVLGNLVTDVRYADLFGLQVPGQKLGNYSNMNIDCDPPQIESLRTSRRIGPDGQIQFDLVAEVVQLQRISDDQGYKIPFWGGSTIFFEPDGKIRYSITKNVCSKLRSDNQKKFIHDEGRSYWTIDPKTKSILPKRNAFRLTHELRP